MSALDVFLGILTGIAIFFISLWLTEMLREKMKHKEAEEWRRRKREDE